MDEIEYNKIEQAKDGVFISMERMGRSGVFDLKCSRSKILGITLIKKNLIYVENSDDFIEIANRKKGELLGIIYWCDDWNDYVWEQCDGIIMATNCMKELLEFMEKLKRVRKRDK